MGGETPGPPTDAENGLAQSVAADIAKNSFTVTVVTPLDKSGHPIKDDSVTYDPHEITIHGVLEEEE